MCYLVDKKWLTDEGESVAVLKSPKREKKAALNASSAKPGCSHWEDNGKNLYFTWCLNGVRMRKVLKGESF